MSQKIRFKIQRFNPEKDDKPYFKTYELDVHPWETVLEALYTINTKVDPSLAYRKSCKAGICGSCAMRINGSAKLSCKTTIKDEIARFGEVVIEPLGNLEIMKDLVVDMEPFYEEMKDVQPWLESMNDTALENRMSHKEVDAIEKSSECIWCGSCFSDCPSRETNKKYLGPAASVVASRFVFDVRDKKKKERLKKVVNKQLWMCAHCERSTENCPSEIKPQEVISRMREESIKEGITNNDGARHARSIQKSVKKYGELHEFRLPIDTFGFIRVIKELPTAIKLFLKGKLPPVFMKKIRNHEEITQLDADVKRTQEAKNKKKLKERQKLIDLERNK